MSLAEESADRELFHELVHAAHPVWRTILAAMREGVLVVDREMTVLVQNPAAAEIFPPPPLSSRPIRLIDLTRDPTLHEGFQQALEHGASVELRFELRRGEPRTFQARIAPLRIVSNMPQAALGVFVEITALERLERIRRDFFANLSHELRTPLAAILAYVETLQETGLDDPEHVRRCLDGLFRQAQRLHALVRDITDLAEIESGAITLSLEAIPLHASVEEVLELTRLQAQERGITIVNEVPEQIHVLADPFRLTQILQNLLDNAVKFNRPGGHVWVRARRLGEHIEISIADTGIGIPPADQPRIFERFYRSEKSRSRETGGSGLGLAIVKHLVQLHGGEIRVRSEPGVGSEFILSLRAAPEPKAAQAEASTDAAMSG
ncbi:MAG: ATP-binding protein [Blastocatellia bacterium]|nr:ATP-binding protein [Blastocatellia bacterium]MCS7156337.1 ATP-binding protein [Blastocatellia bacterium]MCX7751312.1 ATP-binding protein [Blastocatellia bacterium]MDW8169025.1 ATP-binding protein [Acidobacteriota bacterium]MDW8256385.1 ATP-binding protein [Acidobacteriota bacterium]